MPPQTLAQILTDSFLRQTAGPRTYQRGHDYYRTGHVKSLIRETESFTAIVRGQYAYEVFISAGRLSFDYDCDCPMGQEGDFCKHCVAASLAWLHTKAPAASEKPPAPAPITMDDVAQRLHQEPPAALIQLLLTWAEDDDRLRDRLLQFAARRTGPDAAVAAARAAFEEAARPPRYFGYQESADYASDVDNAIDAFQDLLDDGHAAAVIDLCENAVRTIGRAAELVEEDSEIAALQDRLLDLHFDACSQAPQDPIQLAHRLFRLELDRETNAFYRTPDTYKDLLGPAGLIAFKKLAEQPQYATEYRLVSMRESIARATGDVDALVAIFERDLTSAYRYGMIAETFRNAGRHDDALAWAERGLHRYPTDSSLRELAANEYHRRNDHEKAMKLMWSAYQESPSLHSYDTLRRHAEQAGEWPEWRDNAIGLIRRVIAAQKMKGRADHSQLVTIFLHEGKLDEAWHEAQTGGCLDHQWLDLAIKREKDHPGDAAPIYLRQVESEIIRTRNGDYTNPVALLIRAAAVMKTIGAEAEFQRQLAALRLKYKPKRNLIKLLDQRRAQLR